jgi:hypothetical protein
MYLWKVRNVLKKYAGRVFYTATQNNVLKNQPMGRNTVANVPHEIAQRLQLAEPASFTFHSFRRSAATSAADGGSTSEQMTEFFGWRNAAMCQEYISSSKPAVKNMAMKLGAAAAADPATDNFELGEPEVEVEVEVSEDTDMAVPTIVDTAQALAQETPLGEEGGDDVYAANMFQLEEDHELLASAGIPCTVVQTSAIVNDGGDVPTALQHALGSLGNLQGATVNVKLIMNHGTINGGITM